jgi:hypothetical protein
MSHKYNTAMSTISNGGSTVQYQGDKDSNGPTGGQIQSVRNGRINNMLSEYERTKTINQELMRNIGSPKGPVFARVGG